MSFRDEVIRFQRRPVSRSSVAKLADLQKSIDQWEVSRSPLVHWFRY